MTDVSRRPSRRLCLLVGAALAVTGSGSRAADETPAASADGPRDARRVIRLDGEWEFRREAPPDAPWRRVPVPSSFESHEGATFDGVGIYRRTISPFPLREDQRALLCFRAVATDARVLWNGQPVGRHLGGWTPFRIDVTEAVRAAPAGRPHEIRVRVDEKVGHNTQGFLPIVAPHFGGIWQSVDLRIVPDVHIDDLSVRATGDRVTGAVELEVPLHGSVAARGVRAFRIRHRRLGSKQWSPEVIRRRGGVAPRFTVPIPDARAWSPDSPVLYELEVRVGADRVVTRAAFRDIEVDGRRLLLNGRPLCVRGILDWGYRPPDPAPVLEEERFRRDLEHLRARGFNLLKLCLWVPPPRCLEIADEMGILLWQEYPTWHPKLTAEFRDDLVREFAELFRLDRNHPSVILRSLTCETGHGADLDLVRELYDLAHEMVPGAVVEDDSSWIGWNRVNDFWDDHPYGNNHTWVETLARLRRHVDEHGDKPLLLGEAIAADTWIDRTAILESPGGRDAWWRPRFLEATGPWEGAAAALAGPESVSTLISDSRRYALAMRRFQIEVFRREIPEGGFVTSVLRDVTLCSMGFLDYLDRPKWTAADWSWNGDTVCLFATPGDARSFRGDEPLRGELLVSHFGPSAIENAELRAELVDPADASRPRPVFSSDVTIAPGTLRACGRISVPVPPLDRPRRVVLRVALDDGTAPVRSEWPLWVLPAAEAGRGPVLDVRVHESVPAELRATLGRARCRIVSAPSPSARVGDVVTVTRRLDADLVESLRGGGRVLLLASGETNSLPLRSHWLLRGAPWIAAESRLRAIPRDLLLDLQAFDLAGDVIGSVSWLEQIDPLLMLWDTHDLDHVESHAILFETRVDRGRLVVSALRHSGEGNAAGEWLLGALVARLADPAASPGTGRLSAETVARLREKVREEKIPLETLSWSIRTSPDGDGLRRGWHLPDLAVDDSWKPIRIGAHWDGQGLSTWDGWAWYRVTVDVPAGWTGRRVYLTFRGVDDCYEVYANGRKVGSGGDLEKRITAYETRASHEVTAVARPGEPLAIAVRVYDWQGFGGIFRPVTLGTAPLVSPQHELLR